MHGVRGSSGRGIQLEKHSASWRFKRRREPDGGKEFSETKHQRMRMRKAKLGVSRRG